MWWRAPNGLPCCCAAYQQMRTWRSTCAQSTWSLRRLLQALVRQPRASTGRYGAQRADHDGALCFDALVDCVGKAWEQRAAAGAIDGGEHLARQQQPTLGRAAFQPLRDRPTTRSCTPLRSPNPAERADAGFGHRARVHDQSPGYFSASSRAQGRRPRNGFRRGDTALVPAESRFIRDAASLLRRLWTAALGEFKKRAESRRPARRRSA
jgi:hypothetical protein